MLGKNLLRSFALYKSCLSFRFCIRGMETKWSCLGFKDDDIVENLA